ncbi:protein asteroid homolog 1-like [Corticium candelabrum]|uniref:protein asteroid homolog 1-like n=1 Tax=Corticium candelabrum TaxID=121492 RepID=UPI002E274BB7|nr:protein asteroid homolog 1-like [Corticium candelabrum]
MGIRGLTSFVRGIPGVWKLQKLSNTQLIIDGNNLLFQLYDSSKLDMKYGGQYIEYYRLVRVFFSILKKNKIEAIVVLDGVYEDDLKLETQRKRTIERIRRQVKQNVSVPPLFTLEVFCQAVADSSVEINMCDYEGDRVAAQLANSQNCPVLSSDSDFFMFDIPIGVIPFDKFYWKHSRGPISCEIYYQKGFLDCIKLSAQFLPLLSVLLGNDLTNADQLKPLHKYITKNVNGMPFQSLEPATVIAWLRKYSDYIEAEIALFANLEKDCKKFVEILQKSRELYSTGSLSDRALRMVDDIAFPEWVIESFKKMKFSKVAVQAGSRSRIGMRVQMEHMARPSSHTCSRPIRQVMYAILFRGTIDTQSTVTEVGRLDSHVALKEYEVEIPMPDNVCKLAEIQSSCCEERLRVLLSVLGCDIQKLENLEEDWRLPAAALYYWSHLEDHPPSDKAVYAAVFSFVSCYLAFDKLVNEATSSYSLTSLAQPVMPLKELPPERPDVTLTHSFAEFQSILYYTIVLNSVLNFPLPNFNAAQLFNGILVHCAAAKYDTYQEFIAGLKYSKMFENICQLLGRRPPLGRRPRRSVGSRYACLESDNSSDPDDDLTASASLKKC